ncbi:MAG: outer membrane lipoprotein-sorting protein [Epsilonproteobacteria bacterium]|nr:outer membrane lipoprotein-sorting protein [Campylobacterota bacterium]
MKKVVFMSLVGMALYGQSALEVAKKSYEVISGYASSISKTTMILKNAEGEENRRRLEIKKLEGGQGDKSLIHFLYPLDIKDTKLLSFEKIAADDQQWLYLPALKRIKRISARNKSGSFMASEFSYEDIASQNYQNYSYEGEVKETQYQGESYLQITRIPKDKNSGYSRQIVYIDPKSYLAKFGEYFDKQERLLKKVSFLEYQVIDGVNRIKKIAMHNVQNGKSTLLIWDEDKVQVGLKERSFSKRLLK